VVVQVDEVGTAAAAVTSVVMLRASAVPRPTPQVVFNKPFLFNIVDDTTNTVLFQGWVTDPSKSVP
jgi:serine protease inhibitor